MAVFAFDDFSGHTAGNTVQTDADWTRPSWAANDWIVTAGNRVRPNGTTAAVYHNTAPASADYSVSADVYIAAVAAGNVGVAARMSTSANTFYLAGAVRASNTTLSWQLFKFVSGTATQLGSGVTQTGVAAGGSFNIKLNVNGSTIELYDEGGGTPTISASDSDITAAGFAGIRSNRADTDSTGYHLDNFQAEEGGTTFTITPSGGVVFGGTNQAVREKAYVPSGSVVLSGTGNTVKTKTMIVSGGVFLSGNAPITLTNGSTEFLITPSGGITYAGSAPEIKVKLYAPSGALIFNGTNAFVYSNVYTVSGGVTLSGSAAITFVPFGSTTVTTRLPMTGVGQ